VLPGWMLDSARKSSPMANAEFVAPVAARPLSIPLLALIRRALSRWALVAAFFALWEVAPRTGLVDRTFLPPLSEVLVDGWRLIGNGQLLAHVEASVSRALSGLLVAIVIGIPLGLLIGWYARLAEIVTPLLELFRNTAPLALLPVFILLLGIGEASKAALVVYSCLWPILLNTISGVHGVDPLLIKAARGMGLSPVRLFFKVILPAAVPTIFVGVRLAGAFSLVVLIAAEMIGAKSGLGYLIIYSQYNFQLQDMYVGILTITAIGLAFNRGLLALERHFTSWKPPAVR
jgi:NitT/TauT family transport system permease protein